MMAAADDIEVSPLRADDAAAATAALVAAFARDPVLADYLLRRGPHTAAAHDAFFRFNLLRGYLARPKSLALSSVLRVRGGGVVGVALWAPPGPPGSSGLPLGEMLRMLTIARTAFGLLGIGRALRAGLRVDAAHPVAPHYFLGFLAVRPTHQGRGLGARLLAPVLAPTPRALRATSRTAILATHRFMSGSGLRCSARCAWAAQTRPPCGACGGSRARRRRVAFEEGKTIRCLQSAWRRAPPPARRREARA